MKKTIIIGILFIFIPFFAMAMEPNPGCGDTNFNDEEFSDTKKDVLDSDDTPVAAMTGDGTIYDCTDPDNKDLPVCQPIDAGDALSDTPCIGASGCRVTLDYCRDPYQGGYPSCSFTGSCSRSTYKNSCLSLFKNTCGDRYVQWVYLRTYDEWWFLN